MKLIIQIPCLNEEKTLPVTVGDLPVSLPGIDTIEVLVVDDGSTDRTREVARECGVHHVVGFRCNRGLARAFACGLNACLDRGADIVVNTDADNQYRGEDIAKLVEPIVNGEADVVIGDRQTATIPHFSSLKKFLQKKGSSVVGALACVKVPDATSGFRAFTREAALELNVISDFSYTVETLIQSGNKKLAVVSVPIRTNDKLRESRLFRTIYGFVKRSAVTVVRVYLTHEPLKVFLSWASVLFVSGALLFARFMYFFLQGNGRGHMQSLIVGVALFVLAGFFATIGMLADLVNANRRLLEEILRRERDRAP